MSRQLQTIRDRLGGRAVGRTVGRFLDYMTVEAGLSENTLLAYGRDLVAFVEYCRGEHITAIDQIRPETLYGYLRDMSRGGKAEASISRALVAVKMLLRFGVLTGILKDDFTRIIEGPKLWQRLPSICNKEKILELLNAPQPEDPYCLRDKAILEVLYGTGCRASEAAGLKVSDMNLSIGYMRCFGKGSKERIIPLGRMAIAVTKEYIEEQRPMLVKPHSKEHLFLSRTGRGMDRVDIWRVVKKYAKRAGVPGNLTAHSLRHCFASHMLSGGADLRSLQEMLGHVDIATTQIYTHVDHERLKSIHRQFHPRG